MWPSGLALKHQAAKLLQQYSELGCPVDCGPPWTSQHITAAVKRGPHISAKSPQAQACLRQETTEKLAGGYAKLLKWKDIKNSIPTNFKISPIAMIPHKSRQYRAILDLSFQLRLKGEKMPSVNSGTTKLAPQKSMAELGNVLTRIIHTMAQNFDPSHPFAFSKQDIKDGFWRLVVSKEDAWNFCYVLPAPKGTPLDDLEIVVPHSLQMGWSESPPLFCAASETARDVIHTMMESKDILPHHPLEHLVCDNSLTLPSSKLTTAKQEPTTLIEVYMDDFIAATTNLESVHLKQTARAMLHGIHTIFQPPEITGHNGGDPISLKKLEQGDGKWAYIKEILGWIFNGNDYTIELPPKKVTKIIALVKAIAKRDTSSLNQYQIMAGNLQHASFGIPAGKGLFSPIYNAMRHDPPNIPITPALRQALQDWIVIIKRIGSRPTSVLELIPGTPWYIGYCDASGFGAGGVWISGSKQIPPLVWRLEWPEDIQKRLVSDSNPDGDLTNSDLEMAGHLIQWLILEHHAPQSLEHAHIGIFCDNTPTVAWATRLHSSKSVIAGHLLRALALRQHINRTSPLITISIAGILNLMADIASRSFRDSRFINSSAPFADIFTSLFPLPQKNSWTECHLPAKLCLHVISCLRGEPLTMASWTKITKKGKSTGHTGNNTAKPGTSTHTSLIAHHLKPSSFSQHSLLGSGLDTTVEERELQFKLLKSRYQPSPRQSSWVDNPPQSTKQKTLTKSQWHGSLKE